jgi:hypothetical protein
MAVKRAAVRSRNPSGLAGWPCCRVVVGLTQKWEESGGETRQKRRLVVGTLRVWRPLTTASATVSTIREWIVQAWRLTARRRCRAPALVRPTSLHAIGHERNLAAFDQPTIWLTCASSDGLSDITCRRILLNGAQSRFVSPSVHKLSIRASSRVIAREQYTDDLMRRHRLKPSRRERFRRAFVRARWRGRRPLAAPRLVSIGSRDEAARSIGNVHARPSRYVHDKFGCIPATSSIAFQCGLASPAAIPLSRSGPGLPRQPSCSRPCARIGRSVIQCRAGAYHNDDRPPKNRAKTSIVLGSSFTLWSLHP